MADAYMELWKKVEKTDPKHTKAITGKAYQGTSPKPYYLVQKATETFGPCGIGWGFTVLDERIEEGADGERMSIARVRVWYKWNDARGEVEHVGGTQFCGKRASGKFFTDEDAPKKSVTDALVKALSMIGFAGDIFMGLYDDSKYVQDLRNETKAPVQTALPSEIEPEANTQKADAAEVYTQAALYIIKSFKGTKQELGEWWRTEGTARRTANLGPAHIDILRGKLTERADELEKEVA